MNDTLDSLTANVESYGRIRKKLQRSLQDDKTRSALPQRAITRSLDVRTLDVTDHDTVMDIIQGFVITKGGWITCQSRNFLFKSLPVLSVDDNGYVLTAELAGENRSLRVQQNGSGWKIISVAEFDQGQLLPTNAGWVEAAGTPMIAMSEEQKYICTETAFDEDQPARQQADPLEMIYRVYSMGTSSTGLVPALSRLDRIVEPGVDNGS